MRPVLALFIVAVLAIVVPATSPAEIEADYVEARTASVFAGACHFNGEVVTTGREALLAWRVSRGAWRGVDLAGARAVAAVASDDTLAASGASRRSELVVDAASDAQAEALVEALSAGGALGRVERVRRAAIRFERASDGRLTVEADGVAALAVAPLPSDACCKQPHLVWYSPLVRIDGRRVGYTERAWYAGGVGAAWERSGENGAFYGAARVVVN